MASGLSTNNVWAEKPRFEILVQRTQGLVILVEQLTRKAPQNSKLQRLADGHVGLLLVSLC